MKNIKLAITSVLLLFLIKYNAQTQFPALVEKSEASMEDASGKKHEGIFEYYKLSVYKQNMEKSKLNSLDKDKPWELINKEKGTALFNEITKNLRFEIFPNDDRFYLSSKLSLSATAKEEYEKTGGIMNKKDPKSLIDLSVLSSNLINKNTKNKIDIQQLIPFCCNLLVKEKPIKEKLLFYASLQNTTPSNLIGDITVHLQLPTEYEKVEVTKQDLGKTIAIPNNQKVKIIEFTENKIHFEVQNGEKLKSKLAFDNAERNYFSANMVSDYYQFFRNNPNLEYKDFEKKYDAFKKSDSSNKDSNRVYIYSLDANLSQFYFYSPNEKTILKKDLTISVSN